MRLSELIYLCKPKADTPDAKLHWSEDFISNFWLWKVTCQCCQQWRLFVSGMLLGGLPLWVSTLFSGKWWFVFPYAAVVGAMCLTAYFNNKEGKV
jgi:hypothetical protein